jgi:hypothetical protein
MTSNSIGFVGGGRIDRIPGLFGIGSAAPVLALAAPMPL